MDAVIRNLRNAGVALEDGWDEFPELSEGTKAAMLESILGHLDTLWEVEKQRKQKETET
jgi:hypothetical protein